MNCKEYANEILMRIKIVTKHLRAPLVVFMLVMHGNAICQCEGALDQPLESAKSLHQTLSQTLNLKMKDQVAPFMQTISNEYRIVPGQSVGPILLKSLIKQVEGLTGFWGQTQEKRFAYILPVAYQPNREIKNSKNNGLKFSFSLQHVLKEIFVLDQKYKTDQGLGVGSSVALVREIHASQVRKHQKTVFDVCEGITFISDGTTVKEVVVFEK